MALLDDLFSALNQAQTPWAQEALRRMSLGQDLSGIDEELAQRRPRQSAAPAPLPGKAPPPSADTRVPGVGPDTTTAAARVDDAPDFSGGVSPIAKFLGLDAFGIDGGESARIQRLTYDTLIGRGMDKKMAELVARQPALLKSMLPTLVGQRDKPTDEMREYNFDIQQRRARGQTELPTFGDWKANLKKAGANSISIDQRGQSAFEQETGKAQAERLDKVVKGGVAARDELANLEAAQAAIDSYNQGSWFGTGKLGEGEAALRGYARAIGVGNAETLGAAELVRATQNKMALQMRNPDGGMGMPGALSDADREFLRASQPGLDKSPEGNRRMIEISRRMAQRKIEIASMAEKYAQKNRSMTGFEDAVAEYYRDKPLFADLMKQPSSGGPQSRVPNGYRVLGVR